MKISRKLRSMASVAALLLLLALPQAGATDFAASATEVRPLLLGSAVPEVPLHKVDGSATTLAAELGGKPAILVFYRGGWCPYCNLQLSELRLIAAEAKALGFPIIAISPDRPEALAETLGKTELDYALLSDSAGDALKAFGIGFVVDAATLAKYQGYGIDLEVASGETHHALPVPSVFIVDEEGLLQFSYVHPDYRIRVPGKVVLAAAQAIHDRTHRLKPN